MKHEPRLDRDRLAATAREAYGVQLGELEFVPVGFAAVCYTARSGNGSELFLKHWPSHTPRSRAAARQEATLQLMRAMYDRGLFRDLPAPFATRWGKLSAPFQRGMFALFPRLPGRPPPAVLPLELQSEWARTLAHIHRSTPLLGDVLPARETFNIPFESALRRSFARVERIDGGARPGLRELRQLLLPCRHEIEQQLGRLHALRSAVRRLRGPLVLCHTDAGSENLLLDGTRLFVLDWDDATLAPPEHDLHEARAMDLAHVLDVYTAAGGAQLLTVEHFEFYLLRRHLGDATVRIQRMLRGKPTHDEDADMLYGIRAWGFHQWRALPETLDMIGKALSRLQG